jgi:hypothetical protein
MKFFTNATFMLLMIAASSSDVVVTGQLFWDGERPDPDRPDDGPGPDDVPPPTGCQRTCENAFYNCLSSYHAPPFNPESCFDVFFNCYSSCPFREEGVAGLRGGHFMKRVVVEDALE